MTDTDPSALLLRLLRGHLAVLQTNYGLSAAEGARLAAALLRSLLDDSRAEGTVGVVLQALRRDDARLADALGTTGPLRAATLPTSAPPAVAPAAPADPAAQSSWGMADDSVLELDLPGSRPDVGAAAARAAAPGPDARAQLFNFAVTSDLAEDPAPEADAIVLGRALSSVLDVAGPVDAAEIGLELVPVPDDEATGIKPGTVRRHPRFVSRHEVLVAVAGRDELESLWTRDISTGGLFVATDDPPAKGTPLSIKLNTPDGDLDLNGMVVHSVDPAAAANTGGEAGVGVAFTDLTADRRRLLERYVKGLSQKLKDDAAAEVAATDDALARRARLFLALVDASEYYNALDLPPVVDDVQLVRRVDELRALFQPGAAGGQAEQRELTGRALKALDRVAKTLSPRSRRLAHDFTHGHTRADERLAACAAAGQPPDELRTVWHQVCPEKLPQAQALVARAVVLAREQHFAEASAEVGKALELDPFNTQLRAKLAHWKTLARARPG